MNEVNTSPVALVKRPECSKLWEIPSVLVNFETLSSNVRQETFKDLLQNLTYLLL